MTEQAKRIGRERVCGPEEVAALAGVKVGTVAQWRQRGLLPEPDTTISRVPIWLEGTIVRWLQETGRLSEERL